MPPELTPNLLLNAYASGVFPMAEDRDSSDIYWVNPVRRGIIPLDRFHISRSLARRMRRQDFTTSVNADFKGVVTACAGREETWINDTIFDLYSTLHTMGHAHSLEIWQDARLVGGVYGVTLGGAFFGESMFSHVTDASKMALAYLVDRLRQGGFSLLDTQFTTPHLIRLGAIDISRTEYTELLEQALQQVATFTRPEIPTPQAVLQRNTQTS